jgi:hypothetical protein
MFDDNAWRPDTDHHLGSLGGTDAKSGAQERGQNEFPH